MLVSVLITVVLFESGWQAVRLMRTQSDSPLILRLHRRIEIVQTWEEYFLKRYLTGSDLVYAGIHRPHPTRGWAMKPSVSSTPAPGVTYTTNAQGYRALYDYRNDPERYQVLILGDSFTFGDDLDDAKTWPALLQAEHPVLNVLNMAGSGFGIDQMLITLEEEIDSYRPDLVIAAFITDDLGRAVLEFRDYAKPMFTLQDGRLALTHTPVPDVDGVIDEIASRRDEFYSYSSIQTVNFVNRLTSDLVPLQTDVCPAACLDLNRALLDRMRGVAEKHGAEFLLIYLPWGPEIQSQTVQTGGETFFTNYVRQTAVPSLNPRTELLAATFPKARQHYGSAENGLVSSEVMKRISMFESWKAKQRRGER